MLYLFSCALLCFCAVVARLDRHFYKANGSFCIRFISPSQSFPLELAPSSPQIDQILAQPFVYWTKGSQSYVFLSADGRYVLKFYRKAWQMSPSDPAFIANAQGFRDLQTESRLLSVHQRLNRDVLIIDKLHRCYRFNLEELPWMLQERGELFYSVFDSLIKNEELARVVIEKTLALYKSCWEKDYIDRDAIPDINFGLLGLEPMLLDVGRIEKGAQETPLRDYLLQMTASLKRKLEKESPSLYEFYSSIIYQ